MASVLRWLDRNLWSIPLLVLLIAELVFASMSIAGNGVLRTLGPDQKSLYSASVGASGSLLGFLLTSISILAAFPPVEGQGVGAPTGVQVRRARARVMLALASTALMILALLVSALFGLVHFANQTVSPVLNNVMGGLVLAAFAGIVISGGGLALSLAERARKGPGPT